MLKKIGLFVFSALGFCIAIVLVRDTAHNGNDFAVYWKAGKATLAGWSPYLIMNLESWPYKYPPWIAPIFFPFSLIPLAAAKWIWGGIQVASIAWVYIWLLRSGVGRLAASLTLLAFFWVFHFHALMGQFTLPVLALATVGFPLSKKKSRHIWQKILLFWALSYRIFSLFPLIGLVKHYLKPKFLIQLTVALLILGLPVLIVTEGASPILLFQEWAASARNTDQILGYNAMRGASNVGFPAMILRILDIGSEQVFADIAVFLLVAGIAAGLWHKYSKKLSTTEQWVGWLGLCAAVHPVAWLHSFVLAYPLTATALDKAIRSKNKKMIALATLGIISTCWITGRSLGEIGHALELASIKAWGVLISCLVLVLARPRTKKGYR